MYEKVKISPSILSADLCNLEREIKAIESAGAALIHVDVMDGHFVENLTFGLPLIERIKQITHLAIDVHLMVSNPLDVAIKYLNAGADILTVHAEAASTDELMKVIRIVHTAGKKAGVALCPGTNTDVLDDVISALDLVLAMSVEPGHSGQAFQTKVIDKFAEICAIAAAHNCSPLLEADGGIGVGHAQKVCASGADVLVCGNACFCSENYDKSITAIKVDAEIGRVSGLKKFRALEAYL